MDFESECRVCRGGNEIGRPLCQPCLCSGSIALVHQDCLEAWLAHSKSDSCELCNTKYQFSPKYADDAPNFIPFRLLFFSMAKFLAWKLIPYCFRLVSAATLWIVVVPFVTTFTYCFCFNRSTIFYGTISSQMLRKGILYGMLLDGVIAISLLILISFTDFLRVHWAPARLIENIDGNRVQNLNELPILERRNNEGNRMNAGVNRNVDNNEQMRDPFVPPEDDMQDVGIEIRVALFELLGLEGPFLHMFRNASWLLAFSSLYIFALAYVPYMIGSIVIQKINHQEGYLTHFQYLVNDILSEEESVPIKLHDPLIIGIGYVTVFLSVFVMNSAISIGKVLRNQLFISLLSAMNQLSLILKVGCLLLLRILILPLSLGATILMFVSNFVMDYKANHWITFGIRNCVGLYALAWVCGITFMLSMTISVLQLREVLHPSIFAKIIKPQEAHTELINSLVNESGFVHCRRIVLSFCVYLLLLVALVISPALTCQAVLNLFQMKLIHLQLKFCYLFPEIQVPLELLLGHITFLSILDKRKDIIGILQHKWLVYLCALLNLTHMLLPLPAITSDNTEETVGTPLERPPPGWDARIPANSTRWAWGTEIPSEVEKNLAPKSAPSGWIPKLVVLLVLSWLLLSLLALSIFFLPLLTGRLLFQAIRIPESYIHDPACYCIGFVLVKSVFDIFYFPNFFDVMKKSIFVVSVNSWKVGELVVMRISSHLAVGILANLSQTALGAGDETLYYPNTSILPVLRLWLQGAVILEICTILTLFQPIGMRFARFFSLNDLIVWIFDCKLTWNKFFQVLIVDNIKIELVEDHLDIIRETMILPAYQIFVVNGVNLIVISAWLISLFYRHHVEKATIVLVTFLWMALTALKGSSGSLKTFTTVAYQKLFDENYLVGRRLLNFS